MSWKSIVKSVAPTIATVLGGPAAGGAIKVLAGGLLGEDVPEDQMEQKLEAAIQHATPETLAKIKKIDAEYKLRLKELNLKPEELIYQDKADAREMQVKNKSKMPAVLATALTVGFFGVLSALFFFDIPESNKAIVYTMVGSLGTVWLGAMQFWFGTTQSSSEKNSMISKLTQK